MRIAVTRAVAALMLAGALGACRSGRSQLAEPVRPLAQTEWMATLLQSSQEAGAGRHASADKTLADYSVRFPATPEAAEALYWRALHRLDPASANMSAREGGLLLDNYLGSAASQHRTEAMALRRIATALEARSTAAPAAGRAEPAAAVPDKARDEEILRLKDELSKANAELERIKRRLAQPKP